MTQEKLQQEIQDLQTEIGYLAEKVGMLTEACDPVNGWTLPHSIAIIAQVMQERWEEEKFQLQNK